MNLMMYLIVFTKTILVKETKIIWFMSAITLVKLDTKLSVFPKWILIFYALMIITTVAHVTAGMEYRILK